MTGTPEPQEPTTETDEPEDGSDDHYAGVNNPEGETGESDPTFRSRAKFEGDPLIGRQMVETDPPTETVEYEAG